MRRAFELLLVVLLIIQALLIGRLVYITRVADLVHFCSNNGAEICAFV